MYGVAAGYGHRKLVGELAHVRWKAKRRARTRWGIADVLNVVPLRRPSL